MYIPNDFSDRVFKVAPSEKKIYRLKKDLECDHGTFTEGTKVYIEFQFNGNNMAYYHITSSDGVEDGISFTCTNNEELGNFKKWVEETFESAERESREYEELLEKYEKETSSLRKECRKKQGTFLLLTAALITIGIFVVFLSVIFDLSGTVTLLGLIVTITTGAAGITAFYSVENGKEKRLSSLKSTFNKSFADILE